MAKKRKKKKQPAWVIPGLLTQVAKLKKPKVKEDFSWGKESWAEDTYPEFDFIILPVLLFLGKDADLRDEKEIPDILVELFLKLDVSSRQRIFYLEEAKERLWQFISSESRKMKYDFKRRTLSGNKISPAHMLSIMIAGVQGLKSSFLDPIRYKTILREGLPASSLPLKFSQLGRYILNGRADQHWYAGTFSRMSKLFPEGDMNLILDLFAATSIRASLESNVTKFFKALMQFVAFQLSERKDPKGFFKGFLGSTTYQLEYLADGKALGEGKKDKARKIRNFANAMRGDKDAIVVDIWIMRSFDVDKQYLYKERMASRSPSMRTYDAIEWYLKRIAGLFSFEPREICSMIWGGIRSETNDRTTRYDYNVAIRLYNGLFSQHNGKYLSIGTTTANLPEPA